jgi:hypothetical protein
MKASQFRLLVAILKVVHEPFLLLLNFLLTLLHPHGSFSPVLILLRLSNML